MGEDGAAVERHAAPAPRLTRHWLAGQLPVSRRGVPPRLDPSGNARPGLRQERSCLNRSP
jgi:hypothetical protein